MYMQVKVHAPCTWCNVLCRQFHYEEVHSVTILLILHFERVAGLVYITSQGKSQGDPPGKVPSPLWTKSSIYKAPLLLCSRKGSTEMSCEEKAEGKGAAKEAPEPTTSELEPER